MKKPQQIWDEHIGMENQDMRDYMPFLREIAKGDVLEIGVRGGVSTSAFLLGMDDKQEGHLCSIDIDQKCIEVLEHPRWTLITGDSRSVCIPVEEESFDVLLVDGDHHYEYALSDLRRYSPLVKSGGLILMHDVLPTDYSRSCCPEIDECRKAWDDFCLEHPDWTYGIVHGLFGMGVMHKA